MTQHIGTKVNPRNEILQVELSKIRKNVKYTKGLFVRNNMLARAILAVFLMAGYLSAYLAFGTLGLVMLALLVLLALSHPFWFMKWRRDETKRRTDTENDTHSQPCASAEEVHARQF